MQTRPSRRVRRVKTFNSVDFFFIKHFKDEMERKNASAFKRIAIKRADYGDEERKKKSARNSASLSYEARGDHDDKRTAIFVRNL